MSADDPIQAAFEAALRADQEAAVARFLAGDSSINSNSRLTNYAHTLECGCVTCAAGTHLR